MIRLASGIHPLRSNGVQRKQSENRGIPTGNPLDELLPGVTRAENDDPTILRRTSFPAAP
jgi:hypothetical protein